MPQQRRRKPKEGNLSPERFPSIRNSVPFLTGNVMERRGGHKEVFAWLPLLFPMRGGLGLWFPYGFFERYLFALQGKKFTSRGPIQRHVSSGSVGGLAVKGNAAQVKGASLASAWLSPCGVQGKRPCQYFGRRLWVRPRFRLASVRASVCRPVCWKGP